MRLKKIFGIILQTSRNICFRNLSAKVHSPEFFFIRKMSKTLQSKLPAILLMQINWLVRFMYSKTSVMKAVNSFPNTIIMACFQFISTGNKKLSSTLSWISYMSHFLSQTYKRTKHTCLYPCWNVFCTCTLKATSTEISKTPTSGTRVGKFIW